MNKCFKIITSIALVMVMAVMLAVPAFASISGGSKWASFPEVYWGCATSNYVRLAQSYMYRYSNETRAALGGNSAVIDGSFGSLTYAAAK